MMRNRDGKNGGRDGLNVATSAMRARHSRVQSYASAWNRRPFVAV